VSRNAPHQRKLSRWLLPALCGWLLAAPGVVQAAAPASFANPGPRARVVTVQEADALEAFRPRPAVIRGMVDRAITNLTGKPSPAAAWRSLVNTQDVVGIKVFSAPGPNSGTRPAVAAAVVEGLLAAGLPPKHIIVWDRETVDLRLAGYFDLAERYGIRVAGSAQAGWDDKHFYETEILGNLVYGDHEFGVKADGAGRKSFVSKLVSRDITRIINITPLLNHNFIGVSGNLYGLATGSVDNIIRFEANPDRMTRAIPEIYAMEALSDKVVLNITDALICQYEGGDRGLLHYSAILNQLRFSKDPVALDMLSIRELDRQRLAAEAPVVKPNLDLYDTAALLQLGVSDLKRIQLDKVR
jgi:hypothetical protein